MNQKTEVRIPASVTSFFLALSGNDIAAAEEALRAAPSLANARHPETQETPLHVAFKEHNELLVQLLARYEADVNAVARGVSVKDLSIWSRQEALYKRLLDGFLTA